jgi:SAM-dependent methyltransferase
VTAYADGVPDVDMGAFWDARARENAAYFVENRLDYADTDLEEFWTTGPEILDAVLGEIDVRVEPEADVVELGCGIGRLTRVLADRAGSVRALDVSGEMLRRARELNPQLTGVSWLHCDGRSLTGIEDSSADAFFCHVVFQHVPDPAITYAYVTDVGRVLRPGGWAGFQVSNDPAVHRPPPWATRLRRRLRSLSGRAPKGVSHPAWLGSAVDLDDLRATADRAGLDVERVTGEGTQFCYVRLRRR